MITQAKRVVKTDVCRNAAAYPMYARCALQADGQLTSMALPHKPKEQDRFKSL